MTPADIRERAAEYDGSNGELLRALADVVEAGGTIRATITEPTENQWDVFYAALARVEALKP